MTKYVNFPTKLLERQSSTIHLRVSLLVPSGGWWFEKTPQVQLDLPFFNINMNVVLSFLHPLVLASTGTRADILQIGRCFERGLEEQKCVKVYTNDPNVQAKHKYLFT